MIIDQSKSTSLKIHDDIDSFSRPQICSSNSDDVLPKENIFFIQSILLLLNVVTFKNIY